MHTLWRGQVFASRPFMFAASLLCVTLYAPRRPHAIALRPPRYWHARRLLQWGEVQHSKHAQWVSCLHSLAPHPDAVCWGNTAEEIRSTLACIKKGAARKLTTRHCPRFWSKQTPIFPTQEDLFYDLILVRALARS